MRLGSGRGHQKPDPFIAFGFGLTLLCPESSMQRERESPIMNRDLTDAEKDALVEPID